MGIPHPDTFALCQQGFPWREVTRPTLILHFRGLGKNNHLPLGLKRTGILALIKGKAFPLGWYAATAVAEEASRDRRRVLRTGLRSILVSPHLWVALVLVYGIIGAYLLINLGYDKDWSGWHSKKLWDWMQLLIVPLTLALIAYLFTRHERKTERNIVAEQYQQRLLQDYFDRISALLVDKELAKSAPEDRIRSVARVRTLAVLRQSDQIRRGEILRFLSEAKLIQRGDAIINLSGADFSGALLTEVRLEGTDLSGANFSRAALSRANLTKADLTGVILDRCNLERAVLRGTILSNAILERTNCYHADLQKAKLTSAKLDGCILDRANLSGAVLDMVKLKGCSLRRADLRGVQCEETIEMIRCDLRNALLQNSRWPSSGTVKHCCFKNALYDYRTTWPNGWVPPEATSMERFWGDHAKQLRSEERSKERDPL